MEKKTQTTIMGYMGVIMGLYTGCCMTPNSFQRGDKDYIRLYMYIYVGFWVWDNGKEKMETTSMGYVGLI